MHTTEALLALPSDGTRFGDSANLSGEMQHALNHAAEQGLAEKHLLGGEEKILFSLTAAGRAHIDANP